MADRALNQIISDINDAIKTVSFGDKVTTRGLCYLQDKNGKTFPLENEGSRNGSKISWDDKYPLQTYHRIIDVTNESDLTKGFGSNPNRQRVYIMRLVGIGSKDKITNTNYEDNQDVANAVADVFPNFITSNEYSEITDYEVIKQNVYDSEFSDVPENKYKSLEGIAFWLEYTLRVTTCLKPNYPTNLQASVEGVDVSLTWEDNTNGDFSYYEIWRGLSEGSIIKVAETTNPNSYSDEGLSIGTLYYYKVRAAKNSFKSYFSNTTSITTESDIPNAPTYLVAMSEGATQVGLDWTDNTGGVFDEYEIWRGTVSGTLSLHATTPNADTYTDTLSVVAGTEYFYQARASYSGQFSDFSNEANATTDTVFTFTVKSDNSGTSNSDQFTFPQRSSTSPNYIISQEGESGNEITVTADTDPTTITFIGGSGTYNVLITGTDIQPAFSNTGDKDKLLDVVSWGNCILGASAFWGCGNCTFLTATDAPTLGATISNSLRQCGSMVGNSSWDNWDASSVLSHSNLFLLSSSFNQPIGGWGLSVSAENNGSNGTFWLATSFNQPLDGWGWSSMTELGQFFQGASSFNQDLSYIDFSALSDPTNPLTQFISNTGMSSVNYNSMLAKLRADAEGDGILSGMTLGADGLIATGQGVTDRTWLITNTSMTIVDATP